MRTYVFVVIALAALLGMFAVLPTQVRGGSEEPSASPSYICGDADGSGGVNVEDALLVMNYILRGSPVPNPVLAGDADGCGTVNQSDVFQILRHVFYGDPLCPVGITCYYPAGRNLVSFCHPVRKPVVDGDSVPISVYLDNDTPIYGFSLGFHYSSSVPVGVDVSSVSSVGSIMPGLACRVDPVADEVLIINNYGDLENPMPVQSGGLIATIWVQVPIGTSAQVVAFNSAFIAPAGEFILCPAGGGSIVPAFEHAYTGADLVIGNPFVCGDADGNLSFGISDALRLTSYLFADGLAPSPLAAGDADNSGRVNVSDLAYMFQCIFSGGQPCDITDTYCYPTRTNQVTLPYWTSHPVIDGDSVGVPIYLTNDVPLTALTLGFHHNSANVDISSVSFAGSIIPTPGNAKCRLWPLTNEVLVYWVNTGSSSDIPIQTGGLLGTIWFQVPLGTPPQIVDIDTTFIAPAGEFILTKAGGGTIAPGYGDCSQTAELVLGKPYSCGDANRDGMVNISDAVAMINYVFRCAPVPHPLVSADVNCDGMVNITDVVYLINWIFNGPPLAPPPCDPDNDGTPDC
jgi:hypothetical protein